MCDRDGSLCLSRRIRKECLHMLVLEVPPFHRQVVESASFSLGKASSSQTWWYFLWRTWFFQRSLYKAHVGVSVRIALWEETATLTPFPQGKPTLTYKVAHLTSMFWVLRDCRVLSLALSPNKFVTRTDIFPYFWKMAHLGIPIRDRTSYPAPSPMFWYSEGV